MLPTTIPIYSTSSASNDKDGRLLSRSATLVVFRASSAIGRHAWACAEASWSAAHMRMIVAGSEHELMYMSEVRAGSYLQSGVSAVTRGRPSVRPRETLIHTQIDSHFSHSAAWRRLGVEAHARLFVFLER